MHRYLPSPSASAVHFGFLTIHFYALSILFGIVVAILLTRKRWNDAGENPELIYDLALWVIPSGIIGGRIYHVITSPDAYFGKDGTPLSAFKIWEGGLGIWGAVALGATATYLRLRSLGLQEKFPLFADVIAPGLLLAQAIGRWGNWFNIELFGKPSTLPWALEIPQNYRPIGFENFATFHPTFLYESLWCALGALLIFAIPRLSRRNPGSLFLRYIIFYCVGRLAFESLRIDPAHTIAGLRVNIWVSLLGICVATYFLKKSRKSPR